ncbi:MAG: hypothetical protein R6X33_09330 [Candidatus Brocadiia bacterium]
MRELLQLLELRLRTIRYSVRQFFASSRLRIAVVLGIVAFFWLLMFGMFLDVFHFLFTNFRAISDIVLDYLFAFLFVSLLIMMTISDAIIAYTSLFRSDETEFLFALPLHSENTYAYRAGDSVVFSLWGIGTLVLPMIIAYGIVFPNPPWFYPVAIALSLLFVVFATELGAFFALLTGLVLPRGRKKLLVAMATAAVVLLMLWILPLRRQLSGNVFSETAIRSIMDRIAFCQHWALPSQWVSRGMLATSRGDVREGLFFVALLLANVLFFGVVAHRLAHYVYRSTWERVQGASSRRRRRSGGIVDRLLGASVVFLPRRLRRLVLKDLKTFLRDPSQWSQFLLFFGLLGLYILNLPRLGVEQLEPYWHSLIALMNLGATCLTLATLTSRFVFPQLSLEGRRIWILGLLPVPRKTILWGKFLFAAAGTFLVSGFLIGLSDTILGLPFWMVLIHLVVVFCVCCGLNGLAVGLGARYPRLGTDNPSKIVSSFGGTLNLICSICFIAFAVAPVVVPLHMHMMGIWEGTALAWRLGVGLGISLGVSIAATALPMAIGIRAFARMEF